MIGLEWLVSTRVAADVASLVLLKGSMVLVALLCLSWIFRARSAAWHHSLWTLGLSALVLLPLLGTLGPEWGGTSLRYPAETALVGVEALELADPAVHSAEPAVRDDARTARVSGMPLGSLLLLCWWIGAACVGARIATDLGRVAWLRGSSKRAAPGHRAARLMHAARTEAGVTRHVDLLIHPARGVAATVGALRPAVVLGSDVAELPSDQLRPVLLHELAHIRRGDFLTNLMASLGTIPYWPNPLYWVARRHAALALEKACDDEVITGGVSAALYARILMSFAVARTGLSPAMRGSLGVLRLSPTRDRILSILDRGVNRAQLPRGTVLAGAAVALLLATPLGSWTVVSHEPGTGPTSELVEALDHEDATVRARSARTLGLRGPGQARARLETLLDDPEADVRLAAVGALERLGSPASIPAMARVLERRFAGDHGEHGFVLKLAIKALGNTDRTAAADALEDQLERPVPQLRRLALEELLGMPSHWRRALPHLQRFADGDRNAHNRAWASETLARLTPTE